MKTHTLALGLIVAATVCLVEKISGQPSPPPKIDPLTGLPASASGPPMILDLATGLRVPASTLDQDGAWSAKVAFDLIFNGDYDQALRRISQAREKITDSKMMCEVQLCWQRVADKYPPARKAIVEQRDADVRELSNGEGDEKLFNEMSMINDYLKQNFVTDTVFKTIHGLKPNLAKWCYPDAEDSLLRHGEYALCREYYRNPQASFQLYASRLGNERKILPRWQKIEQENQERFEQIKQTQLANEANAQKAWRSNLESRAQPAPFRPASWNHQVTNSPSAFSAPTLPLPPFAPPSLVPPPQATLAKPKSLDLGEMATNNFVSHVRILEEILVKTGDDAEARRIQTEAVTLLDDPRLRELPGGSNKNPAMKPDHSF